MNKVITFVSIFTTIFFLMLTIAFGMIIHFMGDPNQPIFWLFTTLFIGMFLSFIISLGNISSMVKINKLKTLKKKTNDHSFTTCPNYWLKHIVTKPNSEDRVVMCYNILPDKDDVTNKEKLTFIDGSFDGITTGGELNNVHLKITGNLMHPVLTSNLTYLRNMASFSNIEAFSELGNQYDYTDGENYNKNFHYHNNVHITVGPEISGNSNMEDHTHATYSNVGRRGHSHTINWDDMNSQKDVYFETYNPAFSNFDHWINPREISISDGNSKFAIELNLEKLNLANNSCELAKLFNWNEYNSKCVL